MTPYRQMVVWYSNVFSIYALWIGSWVRHLHVTARVLICYMTNPFTSAPSGNPEAATGGGSSNVAPMSLKIFPNVSAVIDA